MLRNLLVFFNLSWLLIILASCTNNGPVPVRDRLPSTHQSTAQTPDQQTTSAEYYVVQPGDNLYRIGLKFGVSPTNLAEWNNLPDVGSISVGTRLIVTPQSAMGATTPNDKDSGVVVHPIPDTSATTTTSPDANPATPNVDSSSATIGNLVWSWPTRTGAVIEPFTTQKRGISIDGKAGDPIYAAANGTVVFAGSSVPGLGNLIIIQHNANYLSAYAHNKTLLVPENAKVKAGQKIAEMGNSDANRIKLHFEIRENGKPVNPLDILPRRN